MKTNQSKIVRESFDGIGWIWRSKGKDYVREFYGGSHYIPDNNFPLQVLFVHDEHCYENYYRRREHSEVFSIELVLEGSMVFKQDAREYRVMPGEVFLIHLDRENEFMVGPEKNCHRLACALTGKCLNYMLHSTRLIEHDVIKLNDVAVVENLMRKCLEVFKTMRPEFRKNAAGLAFQLLLELSECLNKSFHNSDLVDRAVRIMEDHLSQHLSLKKLAELVGTSRSSLTDSFNKHVNDSPINYFIFLKMEAAKSMLVSTGLQVQEIAVMVGYDNPLYFSTEFRKREGVSPREYRRNNASKRKL